MNSTRMTSAQRRSFEKVGGQDNGSLKPTVDHQTPWPRSIHYWTPLYIWAKRPEIVRTLKGRGPLVFPNPCTSRLPV